MEARLKSSGDEDAEDEGDGASNSTTTNPKLLTSTTPTLCQLNNRFMGEEEQHPRFSSFSSTSSYSTSSSLGIPRLSLARGDANNFGDGSMQHPQMHHQQQQQQQSVIVPSSHGFLPEQGFTNNHNNTGELAGQIAANLSSSSGNNSSSLASMLMEQEDWPPVALIGKDDFIGFSSALHCFSPQPSSSPMPSAMLEVVYETSSSPPLAHRGSFGHRPAAGNHHYGSAGISPSPSSYVSSSCSSLQSSEDHHQFRSHRHLAQALSSHNAAVQYHPMSSTATSSSNESTLMAQAHGCSMLAPRSTSLGQAQDYSQRTRTLGSPPSFALAISPPLFGSQFQQNNLMFAPSPGSSYTALTHGSLHLPSFVPSMISPAEQHHQQQQRRRSNEHVLDSNGSLLINKSDDANQRDNVLRSIVVKGELSENEEEEDMIGFKGEMMNEEDYQMHPDGPDGYLRSMLGRDDEEENSTTGSCDYAGYSLVDEKLGIMDGAGMHSSSSSSPMLTSLNREMILHDKMMPMPPAKTRSKMHDLAVKHQLITNQNTRGQGTIQLSSEEKRTLLQEGYSLPTRLPLTRDEEEALKIARRKIKNKLSAQESRRKRKEYMDTLEKKVHAYFGDNVLLKNRVKQLEALNRDLLSQVKKFQATLECSQKEPR